MKLRAAPITTLAAFALIFLAARLSPPPASTQSNILKTPATPAPPIVYVGQASLNLRAEPDASAPVVAVLPSWEVLMVLETQVPWLKVRRPNGQEGWVNGSYLAPSTPAGQPNVVAPSLAATIPAPSQASATPLPTTSSQSSAPAPSQGVAPGAVTAVVDAPQLNLRAGPGQEYPPVTSVPRGTVVTVLFKHRQWRYVQLANGTFGWLNRTYLNVPAFNVPETDSLTPIVGAVTSGQPASAPTSAPTTPAGGPCREGDVMANVHHPARLIVLSRCATVLGTVVEVTFNPEDGDITFRLRTDPGYGQYLGTGNYTNLRGLLQIEIIPAEG